MKEDTNAKSQVAAVTGASRGIGRAIAGELAKSGYKVAIIARDQKRLKAVAAEIQDSGGVCLPVCADISDEGRTIRALHQIDRELGNIEVLVNNAGVFKSAPIEQHPTSLWREVLDTNLTSAFILCRLVLPDMIKRRSGRIINISSISGKVGEMYASAYSASKFGLIGMTQSLALEVASKGVTVNAICPGWVDTDMARSQLQDPQWCKLNSIEISASEAADSRLLRNGIEMAKSSVPQMRFIEPEEVARLVAFLVSDAGRGITGQAINICGGMCLA